MYSTKINLLLGVMAVTAISTPAFADHHDHDYDHNNHHDAVRHEEREEGHAIHHEQAAAQAAAVQQAQFANWNEEREHYRKHWDHMNRERQQELDGQMRAAWLAYHHNNWNGAYSWNNYNDPQFLDYLHGSNPSLLTRLRGIIGM
jgi:hypothetical protein